MKTSSAGKQMIPPHVQQMGMSVAEVAYKAMDIEASPHGVTFDHYACSVGFFMAIGHRVLTSQGVSKKEADQYVTDLSAASLEIARIVLADKSFAVDGDGLIFKKG